MATKLQKKQQKQKERDQKSKAKVLQLRTKTRAKAKEEREEFRKDKLIKKIKRNMEGLDVWADEVYKKMPKETLEQLSHNAKILRALEEEYEAEMKKKRDLQEEFKAKGIDTLDGMLHAVQEKIAQEKQLELTPENGLEAQSGLYSECGPVVPEFDSVESDEAPEFVVET